MRLILVFIRLFNSPSLARSGTCPVCRERLNEDAEEEQEVEVVRVTEVVEDEEEEMEAIMGVDEEVNLLVLDLVEVVVEEEEAGHEEEG